MVHPPSYTRTTVAKEEEAAEVAKKGNDVEEVHDDMLFKDTSRMAY